MKKWLRLSAILLTVALLAGAWTWRYITLNQYYDDLDNSGYKLYQTGEKVPFEDDGYDKDTDLNGYFIRLDGYEIRDYQEYLQSEGVALNEENPAEKLALIHITLINESCDPNPVALSKLTLRGEDMLLNMNVDLLPKVNDVLGGYTAIALNPGTECQIVLPYDLYSNRFEAGTWNLLEEYPLYLKITNIFTQKEISVSGLMY